MTAQPEGPTVVLVGLPGAGKSTIGRLLAQRLGQPFVDSDLMIEQESGKACGDVFTELGEPAFRELEARVVAEALTRHGVVSLGGGAVVTASTRQLLKRHTVAWIDVSVEEGVRRTMAENTRPVLNAEDPAQRYRQLFVTREPLYTEVATARVVTDGRAPADIVDSIITELL
ncbi:shikimate kinase [Corynebacterium aquilae]|nr:shikimate kinase [Corynebacterium aquilae]